jgi:hypothetical protein
MTHYILISVEEYEGDLEAADQAGIGFDGKAEKIALRSKASAKLGPRAWLLDRESEISTLAAIVTAAEAQHLKFRTWFLWDQRMPKRPE